MKTYFLVFVFLAAISVFARDPKVQYFGPVRAENSNIELGILSIENWKTPQTVVANFDSGLAELRFKRELVLQIAPCAGVDSSILLPILGRLTSEKLDSIQPRGEWQFGQPILILLADSTACLPVLTLNKLRWIEIQYGSDLTKAVQRAKRLGEMYREQELGRMHGIFR